MESNDFCLWTFVVVLLTAITNTTGSGNFELQILEISNSNSHLLTGYCCGVPLERRNTQTIGCAPCSTAFRLCLKEYQGTSIPQPGEPSGLVGCAFGNASTGILGGSSFVLSEPEVGVIVLPFTFRWTKSFTLILQALDLYNDSYPDYEQLIDEATFSGVILPSTEWHTLDHFGQNARITYRIRVQCSENYFNTTCTTFCRPRNDRFGHHTCGEKGDKECLAGWQGANCDTAICKPGCDPVHGKCDQPGECECRPGWRGPLCNDCMVYPGCRHGSCNGSAWQCICDTNWGGILCDQDLNYCGTHEPCMHGGTCENTAPDQYRCTCAEGLSGTRCEIVEHPCAPLPCKNGGTCVIKEKSKYGTNQNVNSEGHTIPNTVREMKGMSSMGKPAGSLRNGEVRPNPMTALVKTVPAQVVNEFSCTCAHGWSGPTCEINIDECAGGPCEHGGTCIDLVGAFRCECPPQWSGETCKHDVNECEANASPCINAKLCTNIPGSFQCICREGWGGFTCAKNLDDCVGQCKNGATCIDLVNDYYCACAPGYTGRNCTTDIDECSNSPCVNGGECVDYIGQFKCICPVGYSGTLCEDAENHCTPSPCIEGTCLNTPGGYYCHCPTGRAGRHCELLRKPCKNPPCNDGCTPSAVNDTYSSVIIATPCSGRGKCETNANGSNCICHKGFTGTYCQHNVNECTSNPCKNGGICVNGEADYKCECATGWSGKNCADATQKCLPGQCRLNGGTCVPIDAQCRCTADWESIPCNGRGKCESNGKSSTCACNSGYTGTYCEHIDQCQGQPCHNGGTCQSGAGWFRCSCAQGFSGPDCRINVNECSPQPCLGGATCVDGIGGFTCKCPPGRRGTRCEILLSDPQSVCLNVTNITPYDSLEKFDPEKLSDDATDPNHCNSCICVNGQPKCSNLWCGLTNCLSENAMSKCSIHEVCVPASQDTCLSPPCRPHGDCRSLEPSRRVAPPRLPASTDCWPNQAILGDQCSRISLLLETVHIPKETSVEGICHSIRLLLGVRLVKSSQLTASVFLIVLCDLKLGTNNTIEVTISTTFKGVAGHATINEAVRFLGEVLSSQSNNLGDSYHLDDAEVALLKAILEVKVETALHSNEENHSDYYLIIGFGIAIAALCFGAVIALILRQKITGSINSGLNLSPACELSRHEEEKSNNLQNEENFRRYANPLKGSVTSLRGAMELSLNPAPELSISSTLAGPSSINRSQLIYPSCDTDIKDIDKQKQQQHHQQQQQQMKSQMLLQKTQNSDITKNMAGSIDSPQKDFDKLTLNCHTLPQQSILPTSSSISSDSELLTVHV